MKKVRLAAHRGFMALYPENTMLSFKKALECDIDMIETDVHMTKDGQLVCIHDHGLERTTTGTGWVREHTLEEVLSVDAGVKKGEQFKGERVPTLREFFELVKDRKDIELNIELKDYPHDSHEFAYESCDKTIAMIEEYGLADRIYINSFSGDLLNYVYLKYNDRYRLHGYYNIKILGSHYDNDMLKRLFCACIFNIKVDPVTGAHDWSQNHIVAPKEQFDFVRSYGVEPWVHYGAAEEEERFKTWLERGAVGFTCNDPALASEILKKLGAR